MEGNRGFTVPLPFGLFGAGGFSHALDLQGSLALSSDNVFRGLTQSQGDPSLQAEGYIAATHWFGGKRSRA